MGSRMSRTLEFWPANESGAVEPKRPGISVAIRSCIYPASIGAALIRA